MQNNLWTKGLVIGIIILFLGASVLPSIGRNIDMTNYELSEGKNIYGKFNDGPSVDDWEIIDVVGSWHFNEGSGYVASDDSSYKNNGECLGTQWVSGHDGYGLEFHEEKNSVVIVEDNASLDFNNLGDNEGFMIDFWMKKNQTPSQFYAGLVAKQYEDGGYYVIFGGNNDISFAIGKESTFHYVYSSTLITDNDWHHIVAVWDGTTLYLYIDDMTNPDNSTYVGNFTIGDTWKWLDIGNSWPTDNRNPFDGKIDEVQISRIIPSGGNRPPVVSFNWTPEYPDVNIPITFDASGSYDPDGEIELYEWDFGDANFATGITVNHTYTQSGIYEVVLKVTDNEGAQNKQIKTISITNHPPTVEILNIKPFDYLSGTVIITGRASDPDGNETITKVTVYIKKWEVVKTLPAEGTTYWTCTLNTKEVIEGPTTISAQSEDDGGLVSVPDNRIVFIDNTPPSVVIMRPLSAIYVYDTQKGPFFFAIVIGPIMMMASHIDRPLNGRGIKNVEYYINEECVKNISSPGIISYLWYNVTHFGPIGLEVKAYDYAKHSTTAAKFIVKLF